MAAQQATSSYLHTIVDNISDSIILIDVVSNDRYKILFVNRAFEASVGYMDVVGKEVVDVIGTKAYKSLKYRYDEVKDKKQEIHWRQWSDVPKGQKEFEVKLLPIINAVGECVQIVAISRDVTPT